MRCALVDARRNSSRLLQGVAVSSPTTGGEFRRSRDRRSLLKMAATTISDSARPSLTKGVRLQIDSTTGKSVLLYPEGIVELNETAHEILSRCDGRTLGEIICELAEEYEADRAAIAADVHETLADLQQRKLIEFT